MRSQLIYNCVIDSFGRFTVTLASKPNDFIPCALQRNAVANQAAQSLQIVAVDFNYARPTCAVTVIMLNSLTPARRAPGVFRRFLPIGRHDDPWMLRSRDSATWAASSSEIQSVPNFF